MRNSSRRVGRALLVVSFGLAASLAPVAGSPASATIPTDTVVKAFSGFDSTPEKTAHAHCPAGTHVIGGGFTISNEHIHVFVVRAEPITTPDGDSFLVTTVEDEIGTALNWEASAQAVCTPADFVPRHHIASRARDFGSPGTTNTSAFCADGMTALGAGARIVGGGNQVHIATQMPLVSSVDSLAFGIEDPTGTDLNWQLISYTMCADVWQSDVAVVENDSPVTAESPKFLLAGCPPGTLAISATGLSNNPRDTSLVLLEVIPDRSGARLIAEAINPSSDPWHFELRVICFRAV